MVERYAHWREIPPGRWRWKDFKPDEIADRTTGEIWVNELALDRLQMLRDALGKPVMVYSGCRTAASNRKLGGADDSPHLDGSGFCILMINHDAVAFEIAALQCGFTGIIRYPRDGLVHIDIGPARNLGDRFPAAAGTFSAEAAPARPGASPAGLTLGALGVVTLTGSAADATDHGRRVIDNVAATTGLSSPQVSMMLAGACLVASIGLVVRHWWTHRRPRD